MEIFLTKDSLVEALLCDAPSCSEACLFLSDDLPRLRLLSVQYDLQHDFAWMADVVDRSAVLTLLRVACIEKSHDQGLGPRNWSFSCLPDLVAHCREISKSFSSTCFDQFCWDALNSSFNNCITASTSLRRIGWSSSVSVWGQLRTDGSPLAV